MKSSTLLAASMTLLVFACSKTDSTPTPGEPSATVSTSTLEDSIELDSDDPSILARPFTAEQIREEMIVGLRVMIRHTTPEEVSVELWNVVDADMEGVDLEVSQLNDQQEVIGEPAPQRALWTELRDHASFPAASSSRKWVTMDTDLGLHEGWLYTVEGDAPGVINEFFFSRDLPGAPLVMRVLRDGNEIFKMEQFVRLRPLTP